jgi:hypothetical protein
MTTLKIQRQPLPRAKAYVNGGSVGNRSKPEAGYRVSRAAKAVCNDAVVLNR